MGSRTWVKIYCEKWLEGTLREETPEFRGVWTDVLALAGSSRFADNGMIALSTEVGYSDPQIASILRISLETWVNCKARLVSTQRISLNGNNIIHICNWKKYQSEYIRQKPSRSNKKLQPQVTPASDKSELQPRGVTKGMPEKERRLDRDKSTLIDKVTLDVIERSIDKATLAHWRELFDTLVKAYTKKFNLDGAWEEFVSQMKSGVLTQEILLKKVIPSIPLWEQSEQWKEKDGRYISTLFTFLSQHLWEKIPDGQKIETPEEKHDRRMKWNARKATE